MFWDFSGGVVSGRSEEWIVMGDFNFVMYDHEKQGVRPIRYDSVRPFQEFIFNHGFLDLGFRSDPYKWTNRQSRPREIKQRLDPALWNGPWRLSHEKCIGFHEAMTGSDHRPIRVDLFGDRRKVNPSFRFDVCWLQQSECDTILQMAWDGHEDCTGKLDKTKDTSGVGQVIHRTN
ncbi:hypothetical protein LINGRAHAP2_LOCUS1875 [Linum grandiflorum]